MIFQTFITVFIAISYQTDLVDSIVVPKDVVSMINQINLY